MSWLHGLRHRVADALRGESPDTELNEEIAHHLELETRRQVERGYAPDIARANALRRFGNPARIAQETRDERGPQHLEAGMQDVHYAVRSLRKNPGFTALALLTLALGIGITTVSFSVLDTILLRPLPFRDADRLVLVQDVNDKGVPGPASFPNFVDLRSQAKGFAGIASEMFGYPTSVAVNGKPYRVTTTGVSKQFFRILGAPPVVGREFTDEENTIGGPFAVMVSQEFWRSELGSRLPLGDIEYGGRSVPIVGVVPRGVQLLEPSEFFFPHEQYPGTCRTCRNYLVVGRLARDGTIASGQAAVSTVARGLFKTYGPAETMAVDAKATPLRQYVVGNVKVTLAAILAASALVLLIACTNLLTAQLARGLSRAREVAVRTALGASRGRIIRQLFLESGMLTLAGAVLGTALSFVLLAGVRVVGGGLLPRLGEARVDARVLAFSLVLTALTSLLVGLYPALRLSSARPGEAIRGAARDTSAAAGGWMWTALVSFEIAVAVVLTIGSALMMQTMRKILDNDVGFEPRGVVTALIVPDSALASGPERLRAELAGIPGVTGAAFVSAMPLAWGYQSGPILRPTDVPPKYPGMAGFRVVSPEYFAVMRQPLVRGRAFTSSDVKGSEPVAVVTPGIANLLWPGENPIGKQVRTNYIIDRWLTVVGVVAEASSWRQPKGSQNEIYVSLRQFPERATNQLIAVVRSSANPQSMIPAVRARLAKVAPTIPARFDTIEDRIARTAADRRFAMVALLGFAGVALVLAGIGIYGVMSYAVAARTHEIGVRMALGASPVRIMRLTLGGAALVACVGVAAGSLGGWMATRYISAILYGVTRTDPAPYLIGSGFLTLAALAGALAPALRSSRVDPLVAIRGG
jgi:predicted permease